MTSADSACTGPRNHWTKRAIVRAIACTLLLTVLGSGVALWVACSATDSLLSTTHLLVPHSADSVVVDERTGQVLVIGNGRHSRLTILDTHSGRILRTVTLKGHFVGPVAVAPQTGRVFVLNTVSAYNVAGNTVSILDTRTGALLRTVTVPAGPAAVTVDERSRHVFVVSTGMPNSNGQTRGTDRVSMLDVRSGALLRSVPIRFGSGAAEAVADERTGRVFVASYSSNAMAVLDGRTGLVLRTVKVGVHPCCIAVDEATARVFVADDGSHTVSMLDARTGRVLRTIPIGFPSGLAVDPRAGRVSVANGGSRSISILDARTGANLKTLDVGGGPAAEDNNEQGDSLCIAGNAGAGVYLNLTEVPHGWGGIYGTWNDIASSWAVNKNTCRGAFYSDINGGGVMQGFAWPSSGNFDGTTGHLNNDSLLSVGNTSGC